jgi:hypothetical protein
MLFKYHGQYRLLWRRMQMAIGAPSRPCLSYCIDAMLEIERGRQKGNAIGSLGHNPKVPSNASAPRMDAAHKSVLEG